MKDNMKIEQKASGLSEIPPLTRSCLDAREYYSRLTGYQSLPPEPDDVPNIKSEQHPLKATKIRFTAEDHRRYREKIAAERTAWEGMVAEEQDIRMMKGTERDLTEQTAYRSQYPPIRSEKFKTPRPKSGISVVSGGQMVAASNTPAAKPPSRNSFFNVVSWGICGVLGVLIIGLLFVHFTPGYDISFVHSASMQPAIHTGDLIVTGPPGSQFAADIQPGTIVTFWNGKESVTHRVMEIEGTDMVTKGDANEDPDQGTTPISSIKGVYIMRIPLLGYVSGIVGTRQGWLMYVVFPSLVLVSWLAYEIIKESYKRERI